MDLTLPYLITFRERDNIIKLRSQSTDRFFFKKSTMYTLSLSPLSLF